MSTNPAVTSREATESRSRAVRWAVFTLFVASGAAGLIYEVAWFRMLTYVFGATVLAVSTVLAAFMGGLALGSAALGRQADRMRRPLRAYAYLEIGIAVGALASPYVLRLLEQLALGPFGEMSFGVKSLLRFLVTAAVLLVPTTLMGATLPVMSRFLARRRDSLGLDVGSLYAANTWGAVLGTFVAGFFLIALLGLHATQWVAAGLNLLAAALAWSVSDRTERDNASATDAHDDHDAATAAQSSHQRDKQSESVTTPTLRRLVLITYALSGFVSLSFQVIWTRGLLFANEGTTYVFSAMLTVFLAGLALGSALMTRFVDRYANPARGYAMLLLALGITGGASGIMLLEVAPHWIPFNVQWAKGSPTGVFLLAMGNRFGRAALVMGLPTFIMGMLFPVAARIVVDDMRRVARDVGRLYAFNTVGCILGSFAAGFIIMPALGTPGAIALMVCISLASGVTILLVDRRIGASLRATATVLALAAAVVLIVRLRGLSFAPFLAEELEYQPLMIVEGQMDTVTVTENLLGVRKISVDNIPVAGTDRIMLTDQKSLAHLPALILPEPKAVLTVGFGSGGASYSYTLHPHLTTVHCVEISQTILRPDIQRLLDGSNHGLLDRLPQVPQFRVILDDARSYLRFTPQRYDSIATDCTDLRYKSNANLYDLEYFQLCHDRITDDGMVVVWMPLGGISPDLFEVVVNTFAHVFGDNVHIWYCNNDMVHYILLAGFKRQPTIDYRKVARRAAVAAVAKDLKEIDLDDPDKFLGCYVTGGPKLRQMVEHRRLNTENHPILEFEAPRREADDQDAWDNLQRLYALGGSALDLIDPASIPPERVQRVKRFERAAPIVARGLEALHLRSNLTEAITRFEEARRVAPDDPVLDFLASFVRMDKHLRISIAARARGQQVLTLGEEIDLAFRLGEAREAQARLGDGVHATDRHAKVLEYLGHVLQNVPVQDPVTGAPPALYTDRLARTILLLGRSLIALDRANDARQILARAQPALPGHPDLKALQIELDSPATRPATTAPID